MSWIGLRDRVCYCCYGSRLELSWHGPVHFVNHLAKLCTDSYWHFLSCEKVGIPAELFLEPCEPPVDHIAWHNQLITRYFAAERLHEPEEIERYSFRKILSCSHFGTFFCQQLV